jgi:hypothetical protein
MGAAELDSFAAKVNRKLENTLVVFLSINGFSVDGIAAHSAGRASIILTGGGDLITVLEERIDFTSPLLRKKRHSSQTGSIYMTAADILRWQAVERSDGRVAKRCSQSGNCAPVCLPEI